MSLELINTFGTLLTVAIIAATAIAAMVQLRHLRAGNQINAMLTIGDQVDRREFQDAVTLVRQRLGSSDNPLFGRFWASFKLPYPNIFKLPNLWENNPVTPEYCRSKKPRAGWCRPRCVFQPKIVRTLRCR